MSRLAISVGQPSVIIDSPWLSSTTTIRALRDTAVRQSTIYLDGIGTLAEVPGIDAIELPRDLVDAAPSRQWQFRAGRLCAHHALAALGYSPREVRIPRGPAGAPVWPRGITGSITHTDGCVSAAVARTDAIGALGIDTERIVTEESRRIIVGTVAWASELAAARDAGYDCLVAATLVFSAKETIFKCLRADVGRTFDFRDVRIVSFDPTAFRFTARLVTTLSPAWCAGVVLTGGFAVEAPFVHTCMALSTFEVRNRSLAGGGRSVSRLG